MKVPFVSFLPMEKELDKDLRAAFERVYTRSWYIGGVEDEEFEKAFAQYCTTEYCVGVGNGLDALMLALKALGVGAGDEVIVPSNTYIATALAVTYVGAKLVFVEPDIRTFNINPENIEAAITDKTIAILLEPVQGEGGIIPANVELGRFEKYKKQVVEYVESHRKYLGQMDLNIKSPLVWEYYDDTLRTLAEYGAKIVRLDAFAYAPKEPGEKNFLNEPGTWNLLERIQAIRLINMN